MVKLTIDNTPVQVPEGTTILDAARQAGIPIPSLCYLRGINEIGACRVCMVEVDGIDKLIPSCINVVQEGMVVHSNSPMVREVRKTNVELLLSQHDCRCATCLRSGNCSLQTLANDLGITQVPYQSKLPSSQWSPRSPLIRNAAKCIKCMRCIQICDKVQSLNIWDVEGTGGRTTVDISYNRRIMDSDCSLCGQCITHCPVGALRERDDTHKVFDALADPDKITVVQVAPAVRVAWGESLGMSREEATVGRMVAALRRIGFDYVFDTNFSADLTIMEEAAEFLQRFTSGSLNGRPMFTSCCPAWVRFLKSQFPDMVGELSTAKSPQQMFGAIAKSYYAQLLGVEPERIYCVSIMPCLAKKHECTIPNINAVEQGRDVDVCITTREMARMIRAEHIVPGELEESSFDQPLGISSGAGVIFGVTGGVMEAALRTAYFRVTGQNPSPDAFRNIRGMEGWKEATFDLNGTTVRTAVVSGLRNARKLLTAVRKGKVSYDFVEVMACPGGCSGGGGQPIHDGLELAGERGERLYRLDRVSNPRFSHENSSIVQLYANYLGEPLSHRAHELLHTDHFGWDMPLSLFPYAEAEDYD